MKPEKLILLIIFTWLWAFGQAKVPEIIKLEKDELKNKIKGGWAGQVIGCTYGGPTEFRWNGTMIGYDVPIEWDENKMKWWYENAPGLYDDIYMDLTFVDVYEKHGLDAQDSLHALAFANAEYSLWHANQAARYNILNGIMPPKSGSWKNNPHANDIDFQIEADFAGLMSPGMVNSAVEICNKIGRIMNDGEGVYGGIFVASMYSLSFVHSDIPFIVQEALNVIPKESDFHKCIQDVIDSYKQDPNDWESAWFKVQKKWTSDKWCPDGVFDVFNIDAKINAAYIAIGLLYGNGDFGQTIDISTRCGYDSDCNPSNAGGILGTIIGYDKIPDFWKQGIDKVEDVNFQYTQMSLNKVYEIGTKHAIEMVERNGGEIKEDNILIRYQEPKTVPLDNAFNQSHPVRKTGINQSLSEDNNEVSFSINGCGFMVRGEARKEKGVPDTTLVAEIHVDGKLYQTVYMPTSYLKRKLEVAWDYSLPEGHHQVTLKKVDIPNGYSMQLRDVIEYSENPINDRLK